ncbi:hypothetical protein GGS24DRAFT_452767 [Hypoxylon argillaceum]|nr:hypothetical protein GGS24DRAFT_452767 [Hypoxylon argillaceum]
MFAELRKLLFQYNVIGEALRTTLDFQMCLDMPGLPSTSRLKDMELGVGSLLDINVYSF